MSERNEQKAQSDRPLWRPSLTAFAAVLALMALAIALLGPTAYERDSAFAEQSVTRVEQDVEILGAKWTLAYPSMETRGIAERPLLFYFFAVVGLAVVGGALCFRSLVRGGANWPAIFGLAAAGLALMLAAVLVPVSWVIVVAFIPAIGLILTAAAVGWADAGLPEVPGLDEPA